MVRADGLLKAAQVAIYIDPGLCSGLRAVLRYWVFFQGLCKGSCRILLIEHLETPSVFESTGYHKYFYGFKGY